MSGITAPSATLSDRQLLQLLAPIFPNREIVQLERKPIRSFQHQLEQIHLDFSEEKNGPASENLFFRLYTGTFSWWTLEADLAAREAAAFAHVKNFGLAVPEFLATGRCHPFSISRKAPGLPVADQLGKAAVEALAKNLAQLHSVSANLSPNVEDLPDLSLQRVFRDLLLWSQECPDKTILAMVCWLQLRFRSVKESSCFVHGDCNARNFLVSPAGILTLDLEESGIGDPRIDLATMISNLPREAGGHFLHAYQQESACSFVPGELDPWLELLHVRDIVTANVVAHRHAEGKAIPNFNFRLWLQYATEIYPRVLTAMRSEGT